MSQRIEGCEHPSTVELYDGIFKCSNCGKVWDEADLDQQAKRTEKWNAGKKIQERKAARIEHFKRQYHRRRKP